MKKALSALLIALTIILGVTIAGYQWVKYQYGGETYYAVVGEGKAEAAAQPGKPGKPGKPGNAASDSAAGKPAPVRDLVAYDKNGRKEVCTIQMNLRANKVLRKGSYISLVKSRHGLILRSVQKNAVPQEALRRLRV
ncbi:hypothetical protein KIH75_02980 [Bifidobacterium sp. 64T4]|uniref:hypothetical protein n=1 Tax=Bifidobacterium pongonis TaxID=2834432 RepID=UPI001C57F1AB|nr:hypothetical protein [Bifidobacterium pongonis]MBW3094332.1 hypothetical protein [Bifidobacterium pongonis]